MPELRKAVDSFFARYEPTLDMLDRFIAEQKHHQELVLLACARLDSLANLASAEGTQKARFARFLSRHSALGNRAFAVSVPDLYYHFQHYLWIRVGNIPVEGRIVLYRERDKEYAQFIYDSGVPITQDHIGALLEAILGALKHQYRITPAQSTKKPTSAPVKEVAEVISNAVQKYTSEYGDSDVRVVDSIVSAYTLGSLLYRRYRSTAIHEWGVEVDERQFFAEKDIYWETAPVHSHRFLKAQFSAAFLAGMLKDSISSYKKELIAIRKLPFGLWSGSRLDEEFLDERSVLGEVQVRLVVR